MQNEIEILRNDAENLSLFLNDERSSSLSTPHSSNVKNIISVIFYFYLPFAIRKGTPACTKYYIANYISYAKLSNNHKVFMFRIDNSFVPRNIQEALNDPN